MENANSENNWKYNAALKNFAKTNRKEMTKAEACIWKFLLSGRKMMGYRFRRQRPVSNFIADFMCKELMLIIEIDGITHQWEEVAINDERRSIELENIGFTIIRFTDDEVLNDMINVDRALIHFIEELNWGRIYFNSSQREILGALGLLSE